MRIKPLPPHLLDPDVRYVHDEIAKLVGKSQSQVNMLNDEGSLLGPFPPMLQYPQFGIPALSFLRTLDMHATLDKKVREVVILTVGSAFGARFELYAHEIMAASFGVAPDVIATLAAGGIPQDLNKTETVAHNIARVLASGNVVPDSTYNRAVELLGENGIAELLFLIGGYAFIAMILNGFDISAPTK